MSYYDIYIGSTKCKLYVGNTSVEPFMREDIVLPPNVYGQLSYVFDSNTSTFKVAIAALSDRGKYLLQNGFLAIAITVEGSRRHAPTSRTRNDRNYGQSNKHCLYYRGKWYCSKSDEGLSNHIKKIDSLSQSVTFKLGDVPIISGLGLDAFAAWRAENYPDTDTYCDFRFYLRSLRGDGRFVKTICPKFRIEKI